MPSRKAQKTRAAENSRSKNQSPLPRMFVIRQTGKALLSAADSTISKRQRRLPVVSSNLVRCIASRAGRDERNARLPSQLMRFREDSDARCSNPAFDNASSEGVFSVLSNPANIINCASGFTPCTILLRIT